MKDHVHGLGAALHQALRGQHVLDFAGADAKGQSAKGAVRGGVAVAADDGQAGLGDAQFGADDVHDALIAAGHIEQRDAVMGAVVRQGLELQAGVHVEDGQIAILGGHGMVHHRESQVGAAHLAPGSFESGKGLGRSDFVDQMAVNVDERRLARSLADEVGLPNLFVHC